MGSSRSLLDRVRAGVIGRDAVRVGPYGARRVTYADYTATGRALDLVENAITRDVLPWYANTHTESSTTGRRTTRLREQAREAVRDGVGGSAETAVIFCGSGATGAIDRFITLLGLHGPARGSAPDPRRPIVFVGPYEHHSNEIGWRESTAEVVTIPFDDRGGICADGLERALVRHADRPFKIGSFSAASNVTGVMSDTAAISRLLHTHDALACWDFAAAGPYVDIAMAPRCGHDPDERFDAVFLSPHKMIGGPGSPGVLAVRRALLDNPTPAVPGGGTVRYVSPWGHDFLDDVEHREEGGTPDIIGSIRAGMAFRLKQAIGVDTIAATETRHLRAALDRWREHPRLELLGPTAGHRLPILSFRIRSPRGGHLHHNLVVAMLDDLFGIQSRGGCSCAGPYGHELLGIDRATSRALRQAVATGRADGLKMGWTRVALSYLLSDAEADFVARAIGLIADDGWKLITDYRFDPATGCWTHRRAPCEPAADLGALVLGDHPPGECDHWWAEDPLADQTLAQYLEDADRLLWSLPDDQRPMTPATVSPTFDALRWFDLPAACLRSQPATGRAMPIEHRHRTRPQTVPST
ncbi:MAG: aminotransferase class V-fold PLP-dependent enzyme [Desertimonas sp.]